MAELLTSAQMRAIEQAAIGSGEVSGTALMDRAGSAVVEAMEAMWPGAQHPVVVLCGPGNNGGDGYVVARLLAAQGRAVRVFALAPPASADARAARAGWRGPVEGLDALSGAALAGAVAVDALFGTGLIRDLAPGVWGALALAQGAGCPLVAVDLLSGICADSGRVRSRGGYLDHPATLTVSFDSAKLGHVLDLGGERTGRLVVADIGLGPWHEAYARPRDDEIVAEAEPSGQIDKAGGHKYAHGHALVLSGGVGRGGAARLAARGALRIGAGLVTVGCPPAALIENAARLDAVMLRPMRDGAALRAALADRRITTLCLGPGLGLGAREVGLVAEALAARRATVLDADALSLIASDESLRGALHGRCVLTPHGGEFARLFPDIAAALEAPPQEGAPAMSTVDAARRAARESGAVVLLKGPATVIAAPDGRCAVHAALRGRAAPWLATAGAGDVLAGLVAGLMARGLSPFEAAQTAAWLHVECARAFGAGLIAEDLPDALPGVLRRLAAEGEGADDGRCGRVAP